MPKKKVQARTIKRGDIVKLPDGTEEVVRGVSVVLELSNGNNQSFPVNTVLEVVPPEQVPGRDVPEEEEA